MDEEALEQVTPVQCPILRRQLTQGSRVPVASLLSEKVRNAERGAVAGELGRQLCSDRGGVQKGRVGEVE